jgi:hypothetical protein
MAPNPKNPQTFKDALVDASQSIAGGVGSADYDSNFAGHLLNVIGQFIQQGNQHQQQQQPAPGGATAPGGPPSDGGSPGGPPGSPPPGPAAGGQPGSGPPGGGAQTPPGAPTSPGPGGLPSKGLSPNPDELRRVLADVAGK